MVAHFNTKSQPSPVLPVTNRTKGMACLHDDDDDEIFGSPEFYRSSCISCQGITVTPKITKLGTTIIWDNADISTHLRLSLDLLLLLWLSLWLELLLCFLCFDERLQSKQIAFFITGWEKIEEFHMFATTKRTNKLEKNTSFSVRENMYRKITIMAFKFISSPAHQIKASFVTIKPWKIILLSYWFKLWLRTTEDH
jgi:hypothetical protein